MQLLLLKLHSMRQHFPYSTDMKFHDMNKSFSCHGALRTTQNENPGMVLRADPWAFLGGISFFLFLLSFVFVCFLFVPYPLLRRLLLLLLLLLLRVRSKCLPNRRRRRLAAGFHHSSRSGGATLLRLPLHHPRRHHPPNKLQTYTPTQNLN